MVCYSIIKKKAKAYEYLDDLKNVMVSENHKISDSLLPIKSNEQFKDQLELFLGLDLEVKYDENKNRLHSFDSKLVREIFKNLINNFQSSFF